MSMFDTPLFQLAFKVIASIVFIGLMCGLVKSAIDSWKRKGTLLSILDEVIMGFIGIIVFGIVIALPPSTIINGISEPLKIIYNAIVNFIRETTGLPLPVV